MVDRLTPGQLRDLADLIWGRDLPTPPNYLAATVQIEIAEGLRNSAARREAEGQPGAALDKLANGDEWNTDAPPPTAPFVTDHKWLDPECHASGCQTLILKAELEKLKDQRDKYMWQVRDTCARAEAAEADVKRLRAALVRIDALDPEGEIFALSEGPVRNLVLRMGEIARDALAQGGNDG